jgi:uncharacterized membrane protein YbhN (UPF0104 family)
MRNIRFLLVAFVVLVVAVVFFAPSTDLEPTALRALQAAKALQLALVSAALVLSSLLCFSCFWFLQEYCDSHRASNDDLVALNCTRLC